MVARPRFQAVVSRWWSGGPPGQAAKAAADFETSAPARSPRRPRRRYRARDLGPGATKSSCVRAAAVTGAAALTYLCGASLIRRLTKEAPRPDDPFGLVGETLAGRFRIDRAVGEGGFGVVYRARQLALDRPVAIKVFKPSPDLPDAVFEAEARTVARLKHPGVVEVYDFAVTERAPGAALRWMALEWLEGRTLEAYLAEARSRGTPRMGPAAALELLRPVLQAMAACHREGIVHRDLKPANILLAERHGGVASKVFDFGIAQTVPTDGDGAMAAGRTTRGLPGFSPDYAAPEQVSYGRTGPWTDVHGLGLILTEVLTGEPPYPPGQPEDRFAAVVSAQRPTPAAKGVAVGRWESELARALARRPADRHQDAGVLLAALEENPGHRSPPDGARRGRRILALGLAAAVAALAVVGGGLLSRSPAARVKVAVMPFENLTRDPQQEYFSDGLTEGMISQLGRLSPERLAVIARTSVMQYRHTTKTAREIGHELGVAYLLECGVARAGDRINIDARLIQTTDQTQVWADHYEREVKDLLTLQSELARAIASEVRIKLSLRATADLSRTRSLVPAAYDAYLKARYSSVMGAPPEQVIAYFNRAIELDPTYAAAHAGIALAYASMQIFGDAAAGATIPRAKAAAGRAVELDGRLAEAHAALGEVSLFDWDWTKAAHHLEEAVALDPTSEEVHIHYAEYLITVGRSDEAIAERRRALEISPVSTTQHLGHAYTFARKYDDAIVQFKKAIASDPGPRTPRVLLSFAYAQKEMYREALDELDQVHNAEIHVLGTAGYVHARAGHTARAVQILEQLRALSRTQYVSSYWVADIEAALGRHEDALVSLEKAYRERSFLMIFLKVSPEWDSLRGDPRFTDLVRRVGIP
jgi:TolB-like protein